MSAKRQPHKRHQFTVDGLLRAYSYPLGVNQAEKPIAKNTPVPQKKNMKPDASSTEQTKRVGDKGLRLSVSKEKVR